MKVRAWEEEVSIPTYKTGEPDKNPMFLEKRVYQGSSGAVYPHAVIDKVYDEKEDKIYSAVFLENEYLKIMILPQLGGRVQMALDKTNDYNFVYYNRVIKPALVGLAGPWISGGIEFNWPQHHRPSTFDPVDFYIEQKEDGSQTVWVSEIDQMFHTKGMAGFTLYPGKAYLQVEGKLYNRTSLPQTFLWWANPAVAVDETYQSVFPPDIHAVYDHGKRDVSGFPIAKGIYYKVDYSPGTDISRYNNIPVPTSYMAVNSAFDFVGGYNHGRKAGILHVANHHISPGKKQWTWGCGEFGKAWDRQLTDEDGPYFELMTGMFTNNQPDFSWIMPFEERSFRQYFMPYKNIGYVKNATIDALVNLEKTGTTTVAVKVYVTAERKVSIRLIHHEHLVFEEQADLSPVNTFEKEITLALPCNESMLRLEVLDDGGMCLVSYTPVARLDEQIPDAAKPIIAPENILTTEGLYLAGLHLEQYRHATYSPLDYYSEALKRDPSDLRNNNALGLWYLRRGQFEKAEKYFKAAIATQTKYNDNPYDGEPLYNLGLTLFYQQKFSEAYTHFYKATWNAAWQDKCFLHLARVDASNKNYTLALEHASQAIVKNYHGRQARHLSAAMLRKLGRLKEAEAMARETLGIDVLDFGSGNERYLALKALGNTGTAAEWYRQLHTMMRGDANNYIEIAIDYGHAGLFDEAIDLLQHVSLFPNQSFALYYLAYFHFLRGDKKAAAEIALQALHTGSDGFTNRLEDITMLQCISELNPGDYKAWYHLGNIWYDKRQYDDAISAWESSRKSNQNFATVHRNLGIAYYNRKGSADLALASYKKAFLLDEDDSRVLFELDQLRKRMNVTPNERLAFLSNYPELIRDRDDLYITFVMLHNCTGEYKKAADLLAARNFHPWEGGEGKVTAQYVFSHVELAKEAIREGNFETSIDYLKNAGVYPVNLGEGKLFDTQENDIHYWLGIAYEQSGNDELSAAHLEKASTGCKRPSPAIFYNDQSPDNIFYQGMALRKLHRAEEAGHTFNSMADYGERHMNDEVRVDYFAVSLPDLMIFDDDLSKRNRIHCHYLIGLGALGLEDWHKAEVHFDNVLQMDGNHQGAIIHEKFMKELMNVATVNDKSRRF